MVCLVSVTRLIFCSCAALRNPLGQFSQCLTILSNTRRTRHKAYEALSSTRILLATKIQDSLAKAPTSRDVLCFSVDLTPVHELTKWARRPFI